MWQLDIELNKILKQMWILDEKRASDTGLTQEEKEFYNDHLADVQSYYSEKDIYWKSKKSLD